jgi:hypothetical protein
VLKAEIARLQRELSSAPKVVDVETLRKAEEAGYQRGYDKGVAAARTVKERMLERAMPPGKHRRRARGARRPHDYVACGHVDLTSAEPAGPPAASLPVPLQTRTPPSITIVVAPSHLAELPGCVEKNLPRRQVY